jgi:acid phosphatase
LVHSTEIVRFRALGPAARALALLALVVLAACRSAAGPAPSAPPPGPPAAAPAEIVSTLDAVVWSQTAEEARQLRLSVFRTASAALERALADPSWSALGQGPEAAALPPAVVADVDETMLDNGPYEGRMAREGRGFDEAIWQAWVDSASARPVPGALEFARLAASRGVRLFYVTNRDHDPEEPGTRRNLIAAGFPVDESMDVLLMRGERPEWRSAKSGRIAEVARGHRVLLLLGDDLNDFLDVRDASIAERRAAADAVADRFGTSWFVLPNPTYGSFLRAVQHGLPKDATPDQVRRRKLELLEAFEGPPAAP